MKPGFYPKGLSFDESNNISSNSKPKLLSYGTWMEGAQKEPFP